MDIGILLDVDFGVHIECHSEFVRHECFGLLVGFEFLVFELDDNI